MWYPRQPFFKGGCHQWNWHRVLASEVSFLETLNEVFADDMCSRKKEYQIARISQRIPIPMSPPLLFFPQYHTTTTHTQVNTRFSYHQESSDLFLR